MDFINQRFQSFIWEEIKKYPALIEGAIIVSFVWTSFGNDIVDRLVVYVGWCREQSGDCQIIIRLITMFAVIFAILIIQFVLIPSISKIIKWQNKERHIDFNIVKVGKSYGVGSKFLIPMDFPTKSDAFLYLKISATIKHIKSMDANGVYNDEQFMRFPDTRNGGYNFVPRLSEKIYRNLRWNFTKDELLKLWAWSSSKSNLILFGLQDNEKSFSIYPNPNKKTVLNIHDIENSYGNGNHCFEIKISSRDFFGRLFVQRLICVVKNEDGKLSFQIWENKEWLEKERLLKLIVETK